MVKIVIGSAASCILSFLLSFFMNQFNIIWQKKRAFSQVIRDDIEELHHNKMGTPTLAGIPTIIASSIVFLLFSIFIRPNREILALLCCTLLFSFIGFLDDYTKVKVNNGKGVKGKTRIYIEIIFSLFFLYLLNYQDESNWRLINSFNNDVLILGYFTIPFLVIMIVGSANAVNLTDGLDGLSGGLIMISFIPLYVMALRDKNYSAMILLSCLIGSIFAFLIFNFHPAKVFMGDCGSIAYGFLLAGFSIVLHREILLLLLGGLFVFETLSVIGQVFSFQLFKKRIFLIAPFHHHLEKKGYNEKNIVLGFYVVGLILTIITIFVEVH